MSGTTLQTHKDTGSLTVIAQQPSNNSCAPSQTLYLLYQNCRHQTLNVKILLFPNHETILKHRDSKMKGKDTSPRQTDAFWVLILPVLACPPFPRHAPTFTPSCLQQSLVPPAAGEVGQSAPQEVPFGVTNPPAGAQIIQA